MTTRRSSSVAPVAAVNQTTFSRRSAIATLGVAAPGAFALGTAEKKEKSKMLAAAVSARSVVDLVGRTGATPGEQVIVNRYHADGPDLGGGIFYWVADRPKAGHNGGLVISPTVPWNGNPSSLAAYLAGDGETEPSGTGCWVRQTTGIDLADFGVIPDGHDNTPSVQAAVDVAIELADFTGELGGDYTGVEITCDPTVVVTLGSTVTLPPATIGLHFHNIHFKALETFTGDALLHSVGGTSGAAKNRNLTFSNCRFEGSFVTNGVLLDSTSSVRFTTCLVHAHAEWGIRKREQAVELILEGNFIHQYRFGENPGNPVTGIGVWVERGTDNIMTNNIITSSKIGLLIQPGSANSLIHGNHFYGCEDAAVELQSSLVTLTNNQFDSGTIVVNSDAAPRFKGIRIKDNTYNFPVTPPALRPFIVLKPGGPDTRLDGLYIEGNHIDNRSMEVLRSIVVDTSAGSINPSNANVSIRDNMFFNSGEGSTTQVWSEATMTKQRNAAAAWSFDFRDLIPAWLTIQSALVSASVTSADKAVTFNVESLDTAGVLVAAIDPATGERKAVDATVTVHVKTSIA